MIPATETEPARPLRADARRNRQRILEAAVDVFSEQGVEAQIDDVARRADLGVGTIYRHFPTKEALLAELVRQKFRLFAENAREALERDGEPFEALADLMRRNAEVCARDASIQHALAGLGDQAWEFAAEEMEELRGLSAHLVRRAVEAGTIRPDATDRDVAMLMCGVASTMNNRAAGFDWRRHLELAIEMLRGGRPPADRRDSQ